MIKLNNISFSYGENNVLKNFSLEIKSGDRICLFGDSGFLCARQISDGICKLIL